MIDDRRARGALHGSGRNPRTQADPLTGLHDRRSFLRKAAWQRKAAQYTGRPCALFLIEVAGLKQIQVQYGADERDAVEVAVSEFLKTSFRRRDIAARLGHGEFAVLAPGCANPQAARARLESHIGQYIELFPRPYPFSVRIHSQALH